MLHCFLEIIFSELSAVADYFVGKKIVCHGRQFFRILKFLLETSFLVFLEFLFDLVLGITVMYPRIFQIGQFVARNCYILNN